MTDRGINLSPIKWFGLIITIIALTNITIILDIPVLGQILGFIFLTFIPGFLILLVLKLNRLGLPEKIVLSVGLSVAFSMFFGLAVNGLSLAVGYTKPLSTIPLLISFSTATIILAIIAYVRNKDIAFSLSSLKLTTREKALLIVPSLFPLLSIAGMRIMNLTDNNVLLMLLFFLIPAYIIFISFYRGKVPQRLYPSLIYLIGISLILMLALRSNHIIGSDIHVEYYLFQATVDNLHWSMLGAGLLDACLSILLLPAIYQAFLNINPEHLFKIIYPLLFSVSPLVIYVISKKYIGSFYAFLASFLFISQVVFLWTAGGPRTTMAILFFNLAIMVLFHQDIGESVKRIFFIVFTFSSIVSHYATAYIFFFVLLLTWIGMEIAPRILPRERRIVTPSKNPITGGAHSNSSSGGVMPRGDADTSQSTAFSIPQSQPRKGITIIGVALFFVLLFFWYSQIATATFNISAGFIYQIFASLNQAFLLEAKGTTITAAVGEGISTLPQEIRVVVSWLTVSFVAIGILSTVARYKRMVAIPNSGHSKPNFLYLKFEVEYFVLALASSAILVLTVILPYVTVGYSMERVYFQLLAVLSPFFIIGGIMVAKWLRARPHWIMLAVLIPFFICTTGTMYQLFGVPASIILNSAGSEYQLWYVHDQDSYAAKWIKEYGEEGDRIYTGVSPGSRVLVSQGKFPPSRIGGPFISQYQEGRRIDGYIYLRYADVASGRTVTEYPDIFAGKNKMYSNGGSEVYR